MLSAPGVRWLAWSAAALILVATRCWVLGELVGVREIIPTNEWPVVAVLLDSGHHLRHRSRGWLVVPGQARRLRRVPRVRHGLPCPIGGERRAVGGHTPLIPAGRAARIGRWAAQRCAHQWCVSPNYGAPGASVVTGVRRTRR